MIAHACSLAHYKVIEHGGEVAGFDSSIDQADAVEM